MEESQENDPIGLTHYSLDFAMTEGEDFDLEITPRAGERVVSLAGAGSKELADWTGISGDMKRVAATCDAYVEALHSGTSEAIRDALWMTATVIYSRCFNQGVRTRLDPEVLDEPSYGQAREAHEHFRDLRDKFVGHSVNSYEQTLIYAVLTDAPAQASVKNVGTVHLWANPLNEEGATTLGNLARYFYTIAESKRVAYLQKLHTETLSRPSEELYALPDLELEVPNVASGRTRRRRV